MFANIRRGTGCHRHMDSLQGPPEARTEAGGWQEVPGQGPQLCGRQAAPVPGRISQRRHRTQPGLPETGVVGPSVPSPCAWPPTKGEHVSFLDTVSREGHSQTGMTPRPEDPPAPADSSRVSGEAPGRQGGSQEEHHPWTHSPTATRARSPEGTSSPWGQDLDPEQEWRPPRQGTTAGEAPGSQARERRLCARKPLGPAWAAGSCAQASNPQVMSGLSPGRAGRGGSPVDFPSPKPHLCTPTLPSASRQPHPRSPRQLGGDLERKQKQWPLRARFPEIYGQGLSLALRHHWEHWPGVPRVDLGTCCRSLGDWASSRKGSGWKLSRQGTPGPGAEEDRK